MSWIREHERRLTVVHGRSSLRGLMGDAKSDACVRAMANLAKNKNKDTKIERKSGQPTVHSKGRRETKRSCERSKRRRGCQYSNPRVGSDRQRRRAHTANRVSINRAYIRVLSVFRAICYTCVSFSNVWSNHVGVISRDVRTT